MRNFVQPQARLDGASLLVTGGTGSFGRHFVDTVLRRYDLKRIVIFSRDELKQYEMADRIAVDARKNVRFFLGDVRDVDRLEMAMREIDYVVHAAALKQISAAEYNPFECIRTNVFGAENVVRAALKSGVRKVIALSTDKAANPVSLYGASKLASDKIFVAGNNLSGSLGSKFAVVRYGNVVGSRGSVIPLYKKLLAEGATELPITDMEMTRFWITLDQGVDFVLSSLEGMRGGEIFVPKIPSMRIRDIAGAIAPEATLRVIGARPGEKLHEAMISEDDARNTLELDDRYVLEPAFNFWSAKGYVDAGARQVPSGFRYSSDTNSEWLDRDGLQALLQEAE
ncbi:MAG: UDP-N-acetylglucosamine 4,6-dehydratase (inverting) [Alphaproteobacteria bacterium]|nr:UDP-N-acetylglucosamine 4,6-dehydratase (inverting) [Alphaproteobacteria bacterium]